MNLIVLSPGFLTTVQDQGRLGYERFGVPPAGAMDWFALRAANRLVGNPPDAAGLEFTLEAPVLQAEADCLVAAAGRGFSLLVHGRTVGLWMAAWVRRGEVIHFQPTQEGGWGYLATAGGIDTPPVLGSRSTYLRGGLGGVEGRSLKAGDRLPLSRPFSADDVRRAGCCLRPSARPAYGNVFELPLVPGPQAHWFSDNGLHALLNQPYRIRPTSDRTGYRLEGAPIERRIQGELLSEGMAPGSVQVPADGQPIVMMSDRPTTGGYPKIATLARAGLPLLAQCPPGEGEVRFTAVTVNEAQELYRARLAALEEGIEEGDDGFKL